MAKMYAKNVENPATFVEGFWPEFYARGRIMKSSMSDKDCSKTHSYTDFKLLDFL